MTVIREQPYSAYTNRVASCRGVATLQATATVYGQMQLSA